MDETINIEISAVLESNSVVINVSDSGIGISQEKLNNIRDYLSNGEILEEQSSIGLKNLYERLKLLYDNGSDLKIYSYVLKVRMKIAKNMLDDPNAKIQAISQKVGYQDNNYFSKAFKKYYGLSPSEYRSTKTPSESENKSTI